MEMLDGRKISTQVKNFFSGVDNFETSRKRKKNKEPSVLSLKEITRGDYLSQCSAWSCSTGAAERSRFEIYFYLWKAILIITQLTEISWPEELRKVCSLFAFWWVCSKIPLILSRVHLPNILTWQRKSHMYYVQSLIQDNRNATLWWKFHEKKSRFEPMTFGLGITF